MTYVETVVMWCIAILVIAIIIAIALFVWEPILCWIWIVACILATSYAGLLSFRAIPQNGMLAVYEGSSIANVFVSGTFNETDDVQGGAVAASPTVNFLGYKDHAFFLSPFYETQLLPIDLLEIPLDLIAAVTTEEKLSKKTVPHTPVLIEATLYVRLPPLKAAVAEFVSGFNTRRYGNDLTIPTHMEYTAFDASQGIVQRKDEVACLAVHLKGDMQMAISNTVLSVIGRNKLSDVLRNEESLVETINHELRGTNVFKQLGFDKDEFICELKVERVIVDKDNPVSTPIIASLEADAEAERGRGRKEYLDQVKAGGVSAEKALAADVLTKSNNVSIVLADGGLVGATAAKLLGA